MNYQAKTIRTFIGSMNYQESRTFYQKMGFEEVTLSPKMSLFKVNENLGFYLQDYYVKKWCNNSMVFLEVDDIDKCYADLESKGLHHKYKYVRLHQLSNLIGAENVLCMTLLGFYGTLGSLIN